MAITDNELTRGYIPKGNLTRQAELEAWFKNEQSKNIINVNDDSPLAWQADALCLQTDPEAFFPEKGDSLRDAKRICASCDVAAQCLAYAMENDEQYGIWGGLSAIERRRLKRRAARRS